MAGGISTYGHQRVSVNDPGNDGWQSSEVNDAAAILQGNTPYDILSKGSLVGLMNMARYDGKAEWTLDELISSAGTTVSEFSTDAEELNAQIKRSIEKVDTLSNARAELQTKIATVKTKIASEKDPTKLEQFKKELEMLERAADHTEKVFSQLLTHLKESVERAKADSKGLFQDGTYKGKDGFEKKLDETKLSDFRKTFLALEDRLKVADSKLQDAAASKPGAKAAAGGSSGAGDADDAPRSGARAATGGGPFGQARAGNGLGGFPPLDMNALLMSNYMQQNQLEGTDAMHKTENESKRMMLLFFMLARMAMSGDVGAMYQFLRFIGHIVNKDKAMQNVQLARKLIELQDVSRKLTQMLVDAPAHDEEDQGVQAEYMKLQQKVQAEQGVIATSQKLIAQMLEEFTQVSEMMTGMVKSLLDARGRELSMLAVWRA